MQFSIVIATYNRCTLLQRAVRSALSQTLSAQVIVVDDASSDHTAAVVLAWQADLLDRGDDRLIYVRNPKNCGHSASVNRGVELAESDWIKLLDDDDYLHPNCLAVMAEAIGAHARRFGQGLRPAAAICSCQAAQVDLQEVELSRTLRTGPGRAYYIPQEDVHYGMLLETVPFGTPAQVAFRRDAFLSARGWDSTLDTNFDDIDAWIRIAQFGDAIFVNECLASRTIWQGGLNQRFSIESRYYTNWSIKQRIHPFIHERYQPKLPNDRSLENYLQLHWALVAIKSWQFGSALRLVWRAGWSLSGWWLVLRTRWDRARMAAIWHYRDTQTWLQQRYHRWQRRRSPTQALSPATPRVSGWAGRRLRLRWHLIRGLLRQRDYDLAGRLLLVSLLAWLGDLRRQVSLRSEGTSKASNRSGQHWRDRPMVSQPPWPMGHVRSGQPGKFTLGKFTLGKLSPEKLGSGSVSPGQLGSGSVSPGQCTDYSDRPRRWQDEVLQQALQRLAFVPPVAFRESPSDQAANPMTPPIYFPIHPDLVSGSALSRTAIADARAYLHLRWAWVSWKLGRRWQAVWIALPGLVRLGAWRLLIQQRSIWQGQFLAPRVRKFVLLDFPPPP